ncbi:Peptidase_C39 like family protein [Methanobrevibacter gottschalkii]|uniref:Peptidase_C39 like family protein n=2 Tax=Methanobrevibacter gottschalkii TaxID=190974 RepID=A0A1H7IAH0_9EURY|nr:Peptidase_C39 like family protein [Methanobrevibacter gottschalkii]
MVRFSKKEMQKASKIIRESIKKGKGQPLSVKMVEMDKGKTIKVSKAYYMGLFEAQNIFIRNKGRKPNYVTLNSKANNPLVMDYQDNAYTCCPTSFSMATQLLFDNISEKECAKALNTVLGSGTDPSDLIKNSGKLGYKVTPIKRDYKSVKSSLDKGFAVIAHIQTRPATCLGYSGDYGHYVLLYGAYRKLLTKYYKVADPTKGLKTCKASILDKATNGRNIKYYSVGIL